MTVNDKINAMSVEEKAIFFEKYISCPFCPSVTCNGTKEDCIETLKTLLESEADNDN